MITLLNLYQQKAKEKLKIKDKLNINKFKIPIIEKKLKKMP